jgi:tetratricopeptide (TPR) repeat protein
MRESRSPGSGPAPRARPPSAPFVVRWVTMAAVRRRRPNHLLRQARGPRSQAEVAELANAEIYRATGREGALTAKSISDLECGWYTWPAKSTRNALCAVLGVDEPDELGFAVRRRERSPERVAYALAHPHGTDLATVNGLRKEVVQLAVEYDQAPSAALLALAGECHGKIVQLARHTERSRPRRELHSMLSESAILMGQLVWDASQRRDCAGALAYFDQALAASMVVGSPVAAAQAHLRKSYVALYSVKNPNHGLALAREAARTSAKTSNALTGLAVMHIGEAYAMLGDDAACRRALSDAEALLERSGDTDPAAGFASTIQLGRLAGSCYLSLGNPWRAEPILEDVAEKLRAREKSRAIALGNLALAYTRQGKLDQASATLHEAIDVIEATRGGGGFTVVFTVAQELRPWRHEPVVQDAYDRLLDLIAV